MIPSIACFLLLTMSTMDVESNVKSVALGERVPSIALTDIRFLPRTLDEMGPSRARVLVFVTADCPIAGRYLPRLAEYQEEFGPQGVFFAVVYVGPRDSIRRAANQCLERDLPLRVFRDEGAKAAHLLGVTRTPEAVVLDSQNRLRYRGRIDRQYRLGGARPDRGREDLKIALQEVLDQNDVEIPSTPVDGCLITFEPDRTPSEDVTWSETIAPLVNRHCVECHQPNAEGPFSLTTYDETVAHAAMIDEVIAQERMPPWFAADIGVEYENHRGLRDEEKRLFHDWIANGTPRGQEEVAPSPPEPRSSDWEIGEPDLILTQLTQTDIPEDGYVDYQYVVLPYVFLEETWVSAIEIRASNPVVLHHANLAYLELGEPYKVENFITGTVPGGDPMVLDPGIAVRIPKGSVMGLQAHYVTTGRKEVDRLSVGLRFPRHPVIKRLRHFQITNTRFEIPPEASAHKVTARRTFRHDSTGLGMFAHMHLRGKDMTFRAHYPDGQTAPLLVVPNYSFDWQMSYRWHLGAQKFPKGTTVEVVAHFDNSAFNPYNPDPKKAVRFGLQTFHEMMYGFLFYLEDDERLGLRIDPSNGHVIEGR